MSTPGIHVAKGLPLSLMTSSGTPTSSKQSRSQARIGSRSGPRQHPQPDEEAAVVVDEPDDPDLRVHAGGPLQPEGALDVDVPELVGPGALVARTSWSARRGPCGAVLGEDRIDGVVVERIDVPSA